MNFTKFTLLIVLTVVNVFILSLTISEYKKSQNLKNHVTNVILQSKNLFLDIKETQSSHREYLLTNNKIYLDKYKKYKLISYDDLNNLIKLIKYEEQIVRMSAVKELLDLKYKEFEVITSLVSMNKDDRAIEVLKYSINKNYMIEIEDIVADFISYEYNIVSELEKKLFYLQVILLISIVGELLYIIFLIYLFRIQLKKNNELNDKLILATKSGHIGIWEWNVKTNIHTWNYEMYNLYDLEKKDINSDNNFWFDYVNDECKGKVQKKLDKAFESREPFETIFTIRTKNGTIKHINASALVSFDKNNEVVSMLGINQDITSLVEAKNYAESQKKLAELTVQNLNVEQKKLKEVLLELNYEKEKTQTAYEEAKVSEEEAISSQEELLIVQDELIYANVAKSEFLSNMSHEIRTPLNGIVGIIDILSSETLSKEEYEKYIKILKSSSKMLKSIINDILDYSKIQSGKFKIDMELFNLQFLVNDLKNIFIHQTTKKGLHFELSIDKDVETILLGDSLRLNQILTNLLSNSIKFTKKGSIKLDIKKLFKNDNIIKIRFTVSDTGMGISEKLQEKIFNSFEQGVMSNTKEYQGTGLGLAISKSLVELMGGEIWFDSSENLGTSFYFTIVFDYNKNTNIIDLSNESNDVINYELVKKKTALLVEDSEVNQLVAKKMLNKIGFDVEIADNGEKACIMFDSKTYDMIFMDIQMPVMDGYDATKYIRSKDIDIPIIALSAISLHDDNKIKELGFSGSLLKPINKVDILKEVSKFFDTKNGNNILNKEEKTTENVESFEFLLPEKLSEELDCDIEDIYLLFIKFKRSYEASEIKIMDVSSSEFDAFIHKLKGASGNLKIEKIHNLCKSIEAVSIEEKKALAIKLVDFIKSCILEIEEKIEPLIKKDSLDKNTLTIHTKKILEDVQEYNFIEEKRYKSLLDNLHGLVNDDLIEKFKKALLDGGKDKIEEKLKQIVKEIS